MTSARGAEVLVVGGGVVGLASALALADEGARVTVLERGAPGAEASGAAAGILSPQIEASGPGEEADRFLASRELYPAFVERLRERTGLDAGYRRRGALRLLGAGEGEGEGLLGWQRAAGLRAELWPEARLRREEPDLAPGAALFFADDGQIEPPRLMRALEVAALRAGVTVRSGAHVRRVLSERGRASGVALEDGTRLDAGWVVVAAGSWTTLVEGVPLEPGAVRPSRGQLVELALGAPPLARVVFGAGAYLVPREDGRVVVGSTHEFAGFRREVTARGVRDLLAAAARLCPALEDATFVRAWSNFRPYPQGGRPLVGESEVRGLVLATGHYRNGILLAPLTAELVRAAVLGRAYEVPARTASSGPRPPRATSLGPRPPRAASLGPWPPRPAPVACAAWQG
ncbi:MAG TPA: glycine oxidase ThiO [Polyangiaceae bacterium]|nr:glycine oxidase ThiO [Polyangiaceae bacterium]